LKIENGKWKKRKRSRPTLTYRARDTDTVMKPGAVLVVLVLAWGCGDVPAAPPDPTSVRAPSAAAEQMPDPNVAPATAARDLERDEWRGGHTLARHVGLSDADLRARLRRERRITAASTWNDRQTAERIVAATIARSQIEVDRWRRRGIPRPNLALDWKGPDVIGRTLSRGARRAEPVSCATVVLRARPPDDADYYVLTSYPEPCR
jgi:hypothetical protein